ncbi:hypothetical protein P7D22_00280 [Lichenihabitans sp. Uapishka_5]|uniref:hypothetical protein n=1 Tax=Lichenihabitans sp. Uapishka_5 TaxID=3037302 RepID=UPI0029E7DD03|nr:hypothetical protein [Lichenihabitans sp. Uapishka_5]MDX7949613.1 hypothetical protein [Lichenihabitans sp. Uapishka_5]
MQSLHVLLLAAVPHAEQQATQSNRTAAARLRLLGRTTNVSTAEARLGALLSDPLGAAFRQAIRDLGAALFAMDGTTTLMRYASELLLDMAPAEFAARANLLDQAWHGLGQAQDLWIGY